MINKDYFLANEPLPIRDGLFLYYPSLRQMLVTLSFYYEHLNIMLTQKEHFGDVFENKDDFPILEVLIFIASENKDFLKSLLAALLYFTKRVFFLDEEDLLLYTLDEEGEVDFILNNEDWLRLTSAIAEFNFTSLEDIKKKAKREKPQYANEEARKIAEKIEATRREVEKLKKKKEDNSSPFDKVSEMCAKSNNINILQVWDLNYYQYTSQFRDLLKIESYDMTARAMLAGAKVTLTHWSEQSNSNTKE